MLKKKNIMVKNFGGKKTKGKSRKSFRPKIHNFEELKKIEGQEYGYVNKKFGDGRYELICYDKVSRLGILRGSLRKSARLDVGHLVLVSKRDYQDDKCDIVECYNEEQVDKLIELNEILISFAKEGKHADNSLSSFDSSISFNNQPVNNSSSDSEDGLDINDNNMEEDDLGIDIDDL